MQADWWTLTVNVCEAIYYSSAFRLICVIVVVAATIWMIAKVYSGELQNAEKGPIAIRKHKGAVGSIPRDTIVVHRDLIDLMMDGCHAKCTVMYVYEGYKSKRVHIPLVTKPVRLSVTPAKLSDKVLSIARANEVPKDAGTEEVFWPILDVETDKPVTGNKTPDKATDYAAQQRVLERWSGDDELQLISVHEDLFEEITDARDEFIRDRIQKLRNAKSANWIKRLFAPDAARNRPGAVGNYYLKFQFSNDPLFVLSRHPDRDVRMTAWLTVLTSAFAVLVELFPLQPQMPPHVAEFMRQTVPHIEIPANTHSPARPRVPRP